MSRYKAYSEYKKSRVQWIGEMPSHWNLTRMKEVADVINGYPFDAKKFDPTNGISLVRIRDIFSSSTEIKFDGAVPENALINSGDILIGMDGDFNVAFWAGGSAALNQRVACVRSSSTKVTRYLYYVLPFWMKIVNDLTYFTTVKHLSSVDISKMRFALPPFNELEGIVDFLDYETAKIDALIEKQQRLIELLKEKRQAVISHAVTKGLNPNAPMKDSGLEWLGEVPAHWAITQPRYVCSFVGGGTPSKDNPDFWDGDIPWVSPKDMKVDFILDAQDHISTVAVKNSTVKLIHPGAVLMVMRGMILDHSVPVAVSKVHLTVNQDMKALIPHGGLNEEYLLYCLRGLKTSILDLVESSAHGTKCLRTEQFDRMGIPLPPLPEQLEIVNRLKTKICLIDDLALNAESMIKLAQERLTALISAAVTGKIDVRDWQAAA